MDLVSEKYVIPSPLPHDIQWSDDARIRAIAETMETLAFKMYHSALRFEDDSPPHIPTYGLRLAADEFSRAAFLIFKESMPLPKPIKICLRSHIQTVGIGFRAFARSLESDWNLIKAKCGAHCRICTSRCGCYRMRDFYDILSEIVQQDPSTSFDSKKKNEMKEVFSRASLAMEDYAEHVTKNESFSGTAVFWDKYADEMDKIAEYLFDIL